MFRYSTLVVLISIWQSIFAQSKIDTYYLPNVEFDKKIARPEQVLGFEVGDWHVSHDKLLFYMHTLAEQSDRIKIDTIGFTHEQRPLIHLIITHPDNHKNLEQIRQQHVAITNPTMSVSLANQPVVVWQGYSIHGNEASGSNAALLFAYYLAAATGETIENQLKNAIIILDPSYNPDGLNRFASWVNTNKSISFVTDPNRRETNEPFPRGRTNHYWFDLNRDWLPAQQPESQARLKRFHYWKPNVLTDHHEMGTNSTFFFQPGVPQRTNPITPQKNQELTAKIATFHAKALDKIGSLYYSEEDFDDFYYGKGSTYPDVNGAVGILFEQASSRGHAQDSENGVLTFDFAIRNQLVTSRSTLEAAVNLRKELLTHQQNFYQTASDFAKNTTEKGYLIGGIADVVRLQELAKLFDIHQIEYFKTKHEVTLNQVHFTPQNALVVPLNQPQARLIKAMFDTPTVFRDSIFYDVSAWTLSYAFGLEKVNLSASELNDLKGEKATLNDLIPPQTTIGKSEIGYLLDWKNYYTPKLVYQLLKNNLIVKVSDSPFAYQFGSQKIKLDRGTIFVKTPTDPKQADALHALLQNFAQTHQTRLVAVQTGQTDEGIDLGSPSFHALCLPKVLVVVGEGIDPNEAGEIWHLLDYRMRMQISLVEAKALSKINLNAYTTIILPGGQPQELSAQTLADWVSNGGNLVALGSSLNWLNSNAAFSLETKMREENAQYNSRIAYEKRSLDRGAAYIGGAILEAKLDLTHPLTFGYEREKLAIFKDNRIFLDYPKNPYTTPLVYTANPLLSGYLSATNKAQAANSVGAVAKAIGKGRYIAFAHNPNFRAFWLGTHKLFLNAVFFADLMYN